MKGETAVCLPITPTKPAAGSPARWPNAPKPFTPFWTKQDKPPPVRFSCAWLPSTKAQAAQAYSRIPGGASASPNWPRSNHEWVLPQSPIPTYQLSIYSANTGYSPSTVTQPPASQPSRWPTKRCCTPGNGYAAGWPRAATIYASSSSSLRPPLIGSRLGKTPVSCCTALVWNSSPPGQIQPISPWRQMSRLTWKPVWRHERRGRRKEQRGWPTNRRWNSGRVAFCGRWCLYLLPRRLWPPVCLSLRFASSGRLWKRTASVWRLTRSRPWLTRTQLRRWRWRWQPTRSTSRRQPRSVCCSTRLTRQARGGVTRSPIYFPA